MNLKRLLPLSILFVTGLSFSLLQVQKSSPVIKVEAKVNINDYSDCEEAYENNDANAMLTALRSITSPGSAGSYDQLWETYKTCYIREDGKIFDYYSSITNYRPGTDQAGNYSKEGDKYNREHSIPKSWWGGSESNQGADPYIVVPTDGYVNNARDNYPFGVVAYADRTFSNSKVGTPNSAWGFTSSKVFEPDDSVKGDFARIYYYAIAKYSASYNWTQGSLSSGGGASCFSGNKNINFGLTDYAVKLFSYWSKLDPVSEWEISVNNKVAAIQKNRNPFIDHPEYADTLWGANSGYTRYDSKGVQLSKTTASLLAGNSTTISATVSDTSLTVNWSTNNSSVVSLSATSSASGENVTISGLSAGTATVTASVVIEDTTYSATCNVTVNRQDIHVESVSLNATSLKLSVGQTYELKATVNPSDAANKQVTWSSNNSTVVNVNPATGFITAYAVGTAVITVKTVDGNKTASCTVTVTNGPSSSGGCGGSIATTSVLLSSLAITGVAILLIKKKKYDK